MPAEKDLLTWCDDLHQVKGSISQLQATLNQILTKAPSLEEFKQLSLYLDGIKHGDTKVIADKTRNFLISSQLKVAVRMKFLFDQGLLPFLLALSHINFKSVKSDKYVGYLLDYTPPKDAAEGLPNAIKLKISKKTVDAESPYPPSLPPISNLGLLDRVLTDKSFRKPSDFMELFSASDFSRSHNAKLSIRGRSLLEFILTDIVDYRFPNMHEDDLSYIIRKLSSPSILTKLAFGYNLVGHCKHHLSNKITLEDKLTLFSNIFLAYLGSLVFDGYSLDEILRWISKLFDPIIQDFQESNKQLKPVDHMAWSEFNFLFRQMNDIYSPPSLLNSISVEVETINLDPYVVELKVNGRKLATGTSSTSVDDAKCKAAAEILINKHELDRILAFFIKVHTDALLNDAEVASLVLLRDNHVSEAGPNEMAEDFQGRRISGTPDSGDEYEPTLLKDDSESSDSSADPSPHSPRNTLFSLLAAYNITPSYEMSQLNGESRVSVYAKDIFLASGTGPSKKVASSSAALKALSNQQALSLLGVVPSS